MTSGLRPREENRMPGLRNPKWASKFFASTSLIHFVHFYDSAAQLVDFVARFFGIGLVRGESVVMFATKQHVKAVCERLTEIGFDLDAARAKQQLHVSDAWEILDRLLVDGAP